MWEKHHQGVDPRRVQMCRCHKKLGTWDQVQCLFWLLRIPSESPFTGSVVSALWKCHAGIDCDGAWFLGAKQNKSMGGGTRTGFRGCKRKQWCLGKGKGLKNHVALQLAQGLPQRGIARGSTQIPRLPAHPQDGLQLPSSIRMSSGRLGDLSQSSEDLHSV